MVEELKYFKLAHQLNEEFKVLLIENQVHFRGSLNSLSLISVSSEKPELGIKCKFEKYYSNQNIEVIIDNDIKEINNKKPPQRKTPEKELQAWIINYAFNNNYELPFDKNIKFISSEIAIQNHDGKKRVSDILGYNVLTNQLCIIELKYDRHENRLIEQVNEFENIIKDNIGFFSQLIQIHGFNSNNFNFDSLVKIVVWPHHKSSTKNKFIENNIFEITFLPSYSFIKFK